MSIKAKFKIVKGDFTLDVNLDIPSTGVTGIYGPSGSGKTTLIRAIAGLEKCKDGFLQISDLTWQNDTVLLQPYKRSLGYVFQEPSLFSPLSVRANIEYGYKRVPENVRKLSLDTVIDLLGIAHLLARNPQTLSGGERQRVAIARALAVSPKLLLMDEPLASLDQKSKSEILPYLETLHKELKMPIIYVSHSKEEVARLADHLLLMEKGKIIAAGSINKILTRLDLPLSHEKDAEALIEATVAGHDKEYELTYLDFSGGRFTVPAKPIVIGSKVRLHIAAKDVSITLKPQSETSILNIFPMTIEEIFVESKSQLILKLVSNNAAILARVTRKSSDILQLKPLKMFMCKLKVLQY